MVWEESSARPVVTVQPLSSTSSENQTIIQAGWSELRIRHAARLPPRKLLAAASQISATAGVSTRRETPIPALRADYKTRGYAPKKVPLGDIPSCSPKSGAISVI